LAATPLPSGLSMALLLVWRFFPLLAADARQMRQAAMLRGGAAGDGFFQRLHRGLLVPLAFSVIEYADRVTLALELRGFSPATKRTCAKPPQAGREDLIFLLLTLSAACAAAWLQWRPA
jgi:energy-coupling factor transport system permease protein